MIIEEVLPAYMVMGVSEEKFWESTPEELKPYAKAYELRQKAKDHDMWQMGIYVMSAVQTAVQNTLFGKKSKAEYLKEPLTNKVKPEEKELTEQEKKKGRESLLIALQLMQANFELNHSKDERAGQDSPP